MDVTPGDLTGSERAVLLVLMAQARPVPNPDLIALGPRLEKAGRDKLNRLGLVESNRSGGRFVHELTDRGWRFCHDVIRVGAPPRSTGPAKTLYTVLAGLDRYLAHADRSLAEVFGTVDSTAPPTEVRLQQAYEALATRAGGWVGLARLRAEVADLPRADVDAALLTMHRAAVVTLIPEENQKVLTAADRHAAIEIGGQLRHMMAIEL